MATTKVKKTAKQKWGIFLKVILGIVIVIAILAAVIAAMNIASVKSSNKLIASISAIEYENQLKPEIDEKDGYYTFTTDNDLKVVQLSDIHIGAGFMSTKKDAMAINAVEAMVSAEKPDLVIVTGDIGYPVPFQAGTFNNKNAAKIFANLMEKMEVYWCLTYGNHDTEAYSYFDRSDISKVYGDRDKYPHCLFQEGPDDVDGYGNYVIKVKDTAGKITQAFFMIDSHSYTDGDYFGALWKYDCIHENQIQWYENQILSLTEQNNGETPKSLMFCHIPLIELQEAYNEYKDNGFKDTENVQLVDGLIGETGKVVYSSEHNNGMFDKMLELGSTQGAFFGHDHTNSFSMMYKGIQLGYTYTIDYLAYMDIKSYGLQRGCTVFTVHPDGTYDRQLENYYQDKYETINEKEKVKMVDYNTDRAKEE
nr:metallophosphoesterase [Eubacteriales bacterium]